MIGSPVILEICRARVDFPAPGQPRTRTLLIETIYSLPVNRRHQAAGSGIPGPAGPKAHSGPVIVFIEDTDADRVKLVQRSKSDRIGSMREPAFSPVLGRRAADTPNAFITFLHEHGLQ